MAFAILFRPNEPPELFDGAIGKKWPGGFHMHPVEESFVYFCHSESWCTWTTGNKFVDVPIEHVPAIYKAWIVIL